MEFPPPSAWTKALALFFALAIPVFWTLGLTIAHHFNSRWKPLIPFLVQLGLVTPVIFCLWSEGNEFGIINVVFLYPLALVGTLIVGIAAVIISARTTPNESRPHATVKPDEKTAVR